MKHFVFISLFIFCSGIFSQTNTIEKPYDAYFGKGHFVIKGKAHNKPDKMKYWELAVTDYISNEKFKINLNADGSFIETIPINDVQSVFLYLGDAITIFSYPGDTIEASFDANNPKESLSLKGKNADRQKELDLSMVIFKKFRKAFHDNNSLAYNFSLSDDEILEKVNQYYDNLIDEIDSFEKENGNFTFLTKFRDDAYYRAVRTLFQRNYLIPQVHCRHTKGYTYNFDREGNKKDSVPNLPYKIVDYETFKMSDDYRAFLSAYLSTIPRMLTNQPSPYIEAATMKRTPIKDDYYSALSLLKLPPIRDWYITRLLNNAFTYYDFDEAAFVYNQFREICQNKEYMELIDQKYKAASVLQAGNPAPDFELSDENGKKVRLSDLRGKIVYMDFWAPWCRPCIDEFKNYKDKLYEKYKDYDICYVYICVDGSSEQWKKQIQDHNLKGINLMAEGWESNPVCKAYNVLGIPHYVLIDKNGIIVDSKCDRPSQILKGGESSKFDKLVRQ